MLERENASQMEEYFEQRDRNFCVDQNRKKNQGARPPKNFQSVHSPSRASQARLKSRFEERENRRDNRTSFRENDIGWGEQRFDQAKSWKSQGPKEFGEWDPSRTAGSRGPPKGRNESYNRYGGTSSRATEGRGFGHTRNYTDRDERRTTSYNDKKSGDGRGGRRFGDEDKQGKRFETRRSWEEPKKKPGNRFEKSDEKKSSRISIKKEDIAPPGTKFWERIIEIGSCEKGIVTYYFSPDEFFIQLLAQEEEFKKMMKDIQHYYSDKYSIRDPVTAGDIVIAQFSHDKILYRAEVIKPSPVTVRYIDYGNQEPVQSKGTWLVDNRFLKLPQQVIKCRLSGVQPIGADWPPPGSAIDKFFEYAEYKCTFLSKQGDMYEVSMEAIENGKDVASEIIAAGLGQPLGPKIDIPETDYSLLPNQVLRLFVSHVASSSRFYVLINPKALELIALAIAAVGDAKRSISPLEWSNFQPDMPCLATTDGVLWHRGNIIKADGNEVSVWLIDRGDIIDIPKDKVLHLPDQLKAVEPQAVQCCLHGISVVGNEEDFKEAVQCRNHLVHILSVESKRLTVILYDEEGKLYDFENDCTVAETVEPVGQLPLINQRLPVAISHAESLEEVYIQHVADEADLMSLLEQINRFYADYGEGWQEDGDIPVGTLIAAKSKVFDSWYRARVLSSTSGEPEVLHIDYGNREILPRENVKKLDRSFLEMHAFSRAVALEGDFSKVEDVPEMLNKFWELCDNKDLVGCFINNNGKFVLELRANEERVADLLRIAGSTLVEGRNGFVETTSADCSEKQSASGTDGSLRVFVSHIDSPSCFWVHKEAIVNELQRFQDRLQKSCEDAPEKTDAKVGDLVAAAFSDMWCRGRVTEANDGRLKVQFIDYGNSSTVDSRSKAVKELAPDLDDVPAFTRRFALKGFWTENSTWKFAEIILRHEDPLNVKVLEESEPVLVDLFQNGRSITEMLEEELASEVREHDSDLPTVYITHSISPHEFYVQRETCTAALKDLIERLLDAPSFENPASIEEGELYAAKYPEDETWYRARVISSSEKETVVRFMDYGNTSTASELKRLPEDLADLPSLSERCSLIYGNNCDSWSEAACELFAEYSDGRPLRMKTVVSKGSRTIVRLFHENKSISEELERVCKSDGRKEMYVSHADSPKNFYIQYVNDDQYKTIAEALRDGDEYENLEERQKGALCQACFTEDGCWYRARILQDQGENGCEVFFIDFGNVGIAKELKKLPSELLDIPPRAFKCSLDLGNAEISNSVKEEFVNLTAAGAAVFRGRIISPGETNIVCLKLDGRILVETLDVSPGGLTNGHQNGEVIGFSKESSNGAKEEIKEEHGVITEETVEVKAPKQKNVRNKVDRIVPGCLLRGVRNDPVEKKVYKSSYRKLKFSEKVVPGSISRGVSLESMAEEMEEVETREKKEVSRSAPNTPRFARKSEYVKVDGNERLVPGCISTGMPLHCSPLGEKTARSEKIVPGAVNGSH